MPELIVESLALRISDSSAGHIRIEAITLRALDLLADRLGELGQSQRSSATPGPDVGPIDLERQSDGEVAERIADAWIQALRVRLEG